MEVEPLQRPLTIDAVRDGGVYTLSLESLPQTNLYLRVGGVDRVFVKMPSREGFEEYRRCATPGRSMSGDVRALEDSERLDHLDEMLGRFSEFRDLHAVEREVVHYLAVHRIQYERLRGQALVGIPAARFALLRTGWMNRKLKPVFFQERVEGTTLWDMFDFSVMEVTRPWWPHLPAISAQLGKVLDSKLLTHVDWNIQNFVFRKSDEQLFYVDMKPTIFVRTQSNEQNLKGIREYFVE